MDLKVWTLLWFHSSHDLSTIVDEALTVSATFEGPGALVLSKRNVGSSAAAHMLSSDSTAALTCDRSDVPENRAKHPVCPLLISRQQGDPLCPSPRLYAVTSARWGPGKITMMDLPTYQSICSISCLVASCVSVGFTVSCSLIDCRGLNWKCERAHQNV